MGEELTPTAWLTVAEAQALLGIGATRMAQLTKAGIVPWHASPLDGRVHLIARADVETLLFDAQVYLTLAQTRVLLGVSEAKLRALITSGVLPARRDPRFARRQVVALADVERLKAAGGTRPATRQGARGKGQA